MNIFIRDDRIKENRLLTKAEIEADVVYRATSGNLENYEVQDYGWPLIAGVLMASVVGMLPAALTGPFAIPVYLAELSVGGAVNHHRWQKHFEKSGKPFNETPYLKAVEKLPASPERELMGKFARVARGVENMGRVSWLNDRRLTGDGGPKKLEALYQSGLEIIDSASVDLGLSHAECEELKASFEQGYFPKATEFKPVLTKEHSKVKEAVRTKAASNVATLDLT